MNIGVSLRNLNKDEEAIARQQQALQIYQTIKEIKKEQACHKNIGISLGYLGEYEKAIARQQQALQIYLTIKGTEMEQASCYQNIGGWLGYLGNYEEAIAKQQQAVNIYLAINGTERKQANCHQNIAAFLGLMGNYEEAIARQQQALQIYKSIKGAEREQANWYANIGGFLGSLGKYEEAIAKYQQALNIYLAINGTERNQANCYQNIGTRLNNLCKYEEAIAKQQQALQIYLTIKGTERGQADCYKNIGTSLGNLGKYEEAIAKQQQALQIYQAIKGTEGEQGSCWAHLGNVHLEAGRFSDAIIAYEHATNFVTGPWICRGFGLAYHQRDQSGDQQRAIKQFLQAINFAEQRRSSVRAFEHRTDTFATEVFRDFVSILTDLWEKKVSIEEPEVLRWAQDRKPDRASLDASFHFADQSKGRAFEDAIREKSSLKFASSGTKLLAKDKGLSLRISKLSSLERGLPVTETERRKRLFKDIEQLQQQRNIIEVELKRTTLGDYVAPEFRKPMDMAEDLDTGTAVLQYSIGEKEGWLLILTRDGVTAHKISVQTPALLELLPLQEATQEELIEAWKTRPDQIGLDGLVQLARIRPEDLGKKTKERKNLVDPNMEQAILERLGQVVLPDSVLVKLRLKKIHHLLIVPDGSLHYVPFAMLRINDKDNKKTEYLIGEFAISSVPAMTTLETIRKQKKERQARRKMERRQLLAFANPDFGAGTPSPAADELVTRMRSFRHDYYSSIGLKLTSLPETEAEAMRVASLFAEPKLCRGLVEGWLDGRSVVCVSGGASEDQAKRLLSGGEHVSYWQYLLFSTHGMADTRNGMLSCLALSTPGKDSTEDGLLQAQEVLDMELDTDVVMLSACQTGLGKLSGGEGLVGLSGAFFVAGAETVGASLWQVPSGPTGQLVTEFFKNLKEGKVSRAEALRQAQLQVMQQGLSPDGKTADYSDPFCWAAWKLIGEYK